MKIEKTDDYYIYYVVSKNIKYFRKNSKNAMTQQKLAELSGLSHSLIANIESEKVQQIFSIEALYRIAKTLEVDIKDLLIEHSEIDY